MRGFYRIRLVGAKVYVKASLGFAVIPVPTAHL
jgi:hypothetical protein